MFKLRIVQASYGDSVLLEYGDANNPRHSLVDGGPNRVFEDHLSEVIDTFLDRNGTLDFVNVSHVDGDHITGVLDFFSELKRANVNNESAISVDRLWLNSFSQSFGEDLESKLVSLAVASNGDFREPALAVNGVSQGNSLRIAALQLGIPINPDFPNGLICVDDAPANIEFGNLSLTIVGPTQANLDVLRDKWLTWIENHGPNLASGDAELLRNADTSIPNLSSVVLLAEAEGRTVLFTGDARSDHILDGLAAQNLLDGDGRMHVDVMKQMHHGSDRNVTREFHTKITADRYIISANGHPDNPDEQTLEWIVETAKAANREIELWFTNETDSVRNFKASHPESSYGYTFKLMPDHYHYWTMELD